MTPQLPAQAVLLVWREASERSSFWVSLGQISGQCLHSLARSLLLPLDPPILTPWAGLAVRDAGRECKVAEDLGHRGPVVSYSYP